MFGHQDEPKQTPSDNAVVTAPDEPAGDNALDSKLDELASSPEPAAATGAPAIEAHETDGYIATDAPSHSTDDTAVSSSDDADSSLLDIKKQALTQLSPLVGHLDQSPEEKFRTTMMMIQAADNQALIKDAYEAAQAIPDEKTRAQALLDVINEINYFTQQNPADK